MTNSSRGRLSFLIAVPRISSDRPFEYTYMIGLHQSIAPQMRAKLPYIRGIKRRDACVVPNSPIGLLAVVTASQRIVFHLRELYVLKCLFLVVDDPICPFFIAILHRAEDNSRHFQSRVSQANCGINPFSGGCIRRAIWVKQVLTVRNFRTWRGHYWT